jgi:hypothetical protein
VWITTLIVILPAANKSLFNNYKPMPYTTDNRIVMTLDAGGTNFVFSAARAGEEIIEPIRLPAHRESLNEVLQTIISGFQQVKTLRLLLVLLSLDRPIIQMGSSET